MSDATVEEQAGEAKRSKLPVILGLALLPIGGAGGFFFVSSDPLGLFGTTEQVAEPAPDRYADPMPLGNVAFVEIPAVVIGLSENRTLRFRASLEVPQSSAQAVGRIVPRVQDVLNSYLRAVDPADFDAPGALIRLRGQLLRRIKLVAGDENVRDLLVLEFIVN